MGVVTHDHQTGAPRAFTLCGRTFPVSGLTPYQLGQIEAHLKDAFPSPLVELRELFKWAGDAFTPEERAQLLTDAKKAMEIVLDRHDTQVAGWPVQFNSLLAQKYLFAGAGIGVFLHVVLSKHTPGLTRKEAEDLAKHFTVEDLQRLCTLLQVRPPTGEDVEAGDTPADDDDDDQVDDDLPEGYIDPKG